MEISNGELIGICIVFVAVLMIVVPVVFQIGVEQGRHGEQVICDVNLGMCHSDTNNLLQDVMALSGQLESCKAVLVSEHSGLGFFRILEEEDG